MNYFHPGLLVSRIVARALLLTIFAVGVTAPAMAQTNRFTEDVAKMVANTTASAPAEGGVVFVGSSSIRLWKTLATDFPEVASINHGFGGSRMGDSLFFIEELVLAWKPRTVVLYAGENDVNARVAPEKIVSDFEAFKRKLHQALPNTRLIYIGCKPSPSRWDHQANFAAVNSAIAAICAKDLRCSFVDVGGAMVDEEWEPREDLFVKDRLHMNAKGYAIWTRLLAPLLVD